MRNSLLKSPACLQRFIEFCLQLTFCCLVCFCVILWFICKVCGATATMLSSPMMWTLACYNHGTPSYFNLMNAALEPQTLTMKLNLPDHSASPTLQTHVRTILLSWLQTENRYSADCCCAQNILFFCLSSFLPCLLPPSCFSPSLLLPLKSPPQSQNAADICQTALPFDADNM